MFLKVQYWTRRPSDALIYQGVKHAIQSAFCFVVSLDLSLLNTALRSKFLNDPDATHAFQKVAVAYEVLSKPHLKRLYDNRSPQSHFDVFATRPTGHAEETFRGVILGAFNDFLDGDLEVIRTFLSEFSCLSSSGAPQIDR